MSLYLIVGLAVIGLLSVIKFFLLPLLRAAAYATGYLIFELRLLRRGEQEATKPLWRTVPSFWFRQFLSDLVGRSCDAVECGPYRWEPPFKFKGFDQ